MPNLSKKQKEKVELIRLRNERDFRNSNDPAPSYSKDDTSDDDDDDDEDKYPSIVNLDDGKMILYVDCDVDFVEAKTSVLAPVKRKRSKGADEERFYRWFQDRECRINKAVIEKVSRSEIVHVRFHAAVDKAYKHFADLAAKASGNLIIAADAEGIDPNVPLPAMIQLAARVKHQEYCAVFQLRSDLANSLPPYRHIFEEGLPSGLVNIFRDKNVIFFGKDIAKDITKFTPSLGLSPEEIDDLRIIESSYVFAFCTALIKGGTKLEKWLNTGKGMYFDEVSLKDYLQMIDSRFVVDKSPSNNNHLANFSDAGGKPIPENSIRYAAGDVVFPARRNVTFGEKFFPLHWLATTIGNPLELDDLSVARAVKEVILTDKNPERIISELSPRERTIFEYFRSAKFVTIVFHQNSISSKSGEKVCDFFSFRMDDRIFHYSVGLSATYKKDVARTLANNNNTPIFVYNKAAATRFLRKHFDWIPRKVTDAKAVAADNKILPRLEPMTNALVGGGYCERASNFHGGTMPSQTALRHLDVTASLIREFCLRFKKDKTLTEEPRHFGKHDRGDRRH